MDTQFDYNLLTANYASKLTADARKDLDKKEYIYIKEQILHATECGNSDVILKKKIADCNSKQLIKEGFKVTIEKDQCFTTITGGSSIKNEYWTTTIEW